MTTTPDTQREPGRFSAFIEQSDDEQVASAAFPPWWAELSNALSRIEAGKPYSDVADTQWAQIDPYRRGGEVAQMLAARTLAPQWADFLALLAQMDDAQGRVPDDQVWVLFWKQRSDFIKREAARLIRFDYSPQGGVSWVRSRPAGLQTIWGNPETGHALWVKGEPADTFGLVGTLKTTVTHALICGLVGIEGYEMLLGLPVTALLDGETLLYLSLDRPDQAQRSMERHLSRMSPAQLDRFEAVVRIVSVLDERLRENPDAFVEYVARYPGSPRVVLIEHARNVWGDLAHTDRATVAGDAITRLTTNYGIDSLTLNHAKELGGRKTIFAREDQYGGSNFYNPMGTINSHEVSGRNGANLTIKQWKHPAGERLPAIRARVDFATGTFILRGEGLEGLLEDGAWHTLRELAEAEYGTLPADKSDARKLEKRVERSLAKHVGDGRVEGSEDKYGRKWRGVRS